MILTRIAQFRALEHKIFRHRRRWIVKKGSTSQPWRSIETCLPDVRVEARFAV